MIKHFLPRFRLQTEKSLLSDDISAISDSFDKNYYLSTYPDVAEDENIDPLRHYCLYGWKELRNPTPEFSTSYYLDANPDVRDAGINPFWHYIVAGKAEGRGALAVDKPDTTPLSDEISVISDAFDKNYYLSTYPDVAEDENIDPVRHFCLYGWKELRNPTPEFSTSYYLEANPDVRDAVINPFWHYIVAGKAEARLVRHPGGYRAEALISTLPFEDTVMAWRKQQSVKTLLTADEISEKLRDAALGANAELMISIGHDNYREVSGGVQFCIEQEENIAAARGVVYLNLHPHQPLPRLAHSSEDPDVVVTVLLSGTEIGTTTMATMAQAAGAMVGLFKKTDVVVHHMMGQSPEQIADLVKATKGGKCWVWLHDFFTLCPSHALQRNNVSFCGAPEVKSNACSLCLYGVERIDHIARMTAFFAAIDVHVIAPSQFTLDYWRGHSNLKTASAHVNPHMGLCWESKPLARKPRKDLTVAFVGYPAAHKGWPIFQRIVRESRRMGSTFRFVYFGTTPIGLDEVEVIPVRVTADNPDAMISAIKDQGVDFVMHWASCAETFSFSTYEAMAAGANVLTNPSSGNVAVTVKQFGFGAVLEDEADLEAFFIDGRAQNMVKEQPDKSIARIKRSDMTFSVLDTVGQQ